MNGPAASPSRTPALVHAALLAVSLLFGANTVIAKVALRELAPLDLVVIRTAGTAAILFAFSGWRRRGEATRPRLGPSDVGRILLYSLLGASINQVCFLAGLARSTATNASLMVVAVPVLTLALAVALRSFPPGAVRERWPRQDRPLPLSRYPDPGYLVMLFRDIEDPSSGY